MPRITYVPKKFTAEHEAIVRQANAICAEYRDDGYDLTLRQLFYQFVARAIIPNTVQSYKRLGSIVNDARLAGRIDWNYLVDRTRGVEDLAHWTSPAEIVDAVARQFRLAKWDRQPERVEVWVEKEALAGVVERICQRLDVPYLACRGYVSQSEQWAAAQRLGGYIANGQRVTVLHLGDHDPSGIDMTRDNRDRLRTFVEQDWLNGHMPGVGSTTIGEIRASMADHVGGDAFVVERIALNMDQVEQYDPPPNPAKFTDSRVHTYVEQFGRSSWELDALPPDVLAALIEDHVLRHRDEDLWDEVAEEEDEHKRVLALAAAQWPQVAEYVDRHTDEEE